MFWAKTLEGHVPEEVSQAFSLRTALRILFSLSPHLALPFSNSYQRSRSQQEPEGVHACLYTLTLLIYSNPLKPTSQRFRFKQDDAENTAGNPRPQRRGAHLQLGTCSLPFYQRLPTLTYPLPVKFHTSLRLTSFCSPWPASLVLWDRTGPHSLWSRALEGRGSDPGTVESEN